MVDPQNLPEGFVPADWPKWTDGCAVQSNGDWGLGGHGYGVVSVDTSRMLTDFVCIPRPIKRAATPDGGPLRFRCVRPTQPWAS